MAQLLNYMQQYVCYALLKKLLYYLLNSRCVFDCFVMQCFFIIFVLSYSH
jgi:hypothetical protein